MKINYCNFKGCNVLTIIVSFAGVLFFLLTFFFKVYAEDNKPDISNGNNNEKIFIKANSLFADSLNKYITFTENVVATQGTTTIYADELKIYYKKQLDNNADFAADEDSMEKIIANGNVKILFDDQVALTKKAIYKTDKRILILLGNGSKITSEKNSIVGAEIILYRTNGRIEVKSGDQSSVEALIYSGKKGIN